MTVKLYAFTCGTVTGEFAHLMEGGEGDITVPIPVFLIEHFMGLALFDTGLHPDCQHDPAGRLGERLTRLFRIGFQPGEEISVWIGMQLGPRRYFYEVIDMTKGTVSSLGSRSAPIGTPARTNIAMYIRALQRFRVGT